ncbi:MAG: AMIN domain-containing protein, partial [Methylococcus sp.]
MTASSVAKCRKLRIIHRVSVKALMLVVLTVWLGSAHAASRLLSMDYSLLPGDRLEFKLSLDGQARLPRDFQTENPSRIVLDLPGVSNGLNQKTIRIQRAGVKDVQVVEASGR